MVIVMEYFKKLYENNIGIQYIDSPIRIIGVAILQDTVDEDVLGRVKLLNQGNQIITAIQIKYTVFDVFDERIGKPEYYMYQDMQMAPGEVIGNKNAIKLPPNSRRIEVELVRAIFKDSNIWKADDLQSQNNLPMDRINVAEDLLKPLGKKLSVLIENTDYIEYYFAENENAWLCSCGRINSIDHSDCGFCRKQYRHVKDFLSKASLTNLCDEIKAEERAKKEEQERLEAALRLQKEKEEREEQERIRQHEEEEKAKAEIEKKAKAKKNKKLSIVVGVAALIVLISILSVKVFLPSSHIHKAEQLSQEGKWEEAIAELEVAEGSVYDINNYKFEILCQKGELEQSEEKWDLAIATYKEAAQFGDTEELIKETYYLEGESKRAAQNWDGAVLAFSSAGDYKDAKKKILATRFDEGVADRKLGHYEQAIAAFEKAEKFNGAAKEIDRTYDKMAQEYYDNGEYDKAFEIWADLAENDSVIEAFLKSDSKMREAGKRYRASVGNEVEFGNYYMKDKYWIEDHDEKEPITWDIIAQEGNKVLLLSDEILDEQYYNETRSDTTWETCSLRKWLNNDFYKMAFNEKEQKAIISTNLSNGKDQCNPEWDTYGGNDTTDKVFLLSYQEVLKYLPEEKSRKCFMSSYAKSLVGVNIWILRSPGAEQDCVASVGSEGELYGHGEVWQVPDSIRPAIWVDLDKVDF